MSRQDTALAAASMLARNAPLAVDLAPVAQTHHRHRDAGILDLADQPPVPDAVFPERFPDGRRQFVRFDLQGEHVVVDNVQAVSGPSPEL